MRRFWPWFIHLIDFCDIDDCPVYADNAIANFEMRKRINKWSARFWSHWQ